MIKIIAIFVGVLIIFGLSAIVVISIENQNSQHITYGITVHNLDSTLINDVKDLGMTYVRSDVGSPQWQNIYNTAISNHVKILGIIDYFQFSSHIITLSEWNATVLSDVQSYPGVTAWEIWNEPDLNGNGFPVINATFYFEMLKSAYTIIHKYENNPTIIGLGGYNTPFSTFQLTWLIQLVSLGFQKYCNAVSVHLYTPVNISATYLTQYKETINLIQNEVSLPLWITETGIGAPQQPTYIPLVYELLIKSGITHIFWYDLYGESFFWYYNANFGLLYTNEQPTPGYAVMEKFIQEHP